jgi:uncharacterized protein (DUF1684 family)
VTLAVTADLPSATYVREIGEFRAEREAGLKADDGWLTVVGLHWLNNGENRVGSDPSFEVPLPEPAPKRVGTILVEKGQARFRPAPGIALTETVLQEDTTEVLSLGRVSFYIIKRGNRLAVRVKNNDSSARKEFTGLRWFPVNASWRIQARFTAYKNKRTITFHTLAGVDEPLESPGYVTFVKSGREFRLEPVWDEKQLFFVFRDQTSGKTTYAAARFLYADPPKDGIVWLDFNKAQNPPCVFTAYATCPLPPPQNRLPIEVTAGEEMYGKNTH